MLGDSASPEPDPGWASERGSTRGKLISGDRAYVHSQSFRQYARTIFAEMDIIIVRRKIQFIHIFAAHAVPIDQNVVPEPRIAPARSEVILDLAIEYYEGRFAKAYVSCREFCSADCRGSDSTKQWLEYVLNIGVKPDRDSFTTVENGSSSVAKEGIQGVAFFCFRIEWDNFVGSSGWYLRLSCLKNRSTNRSTNAA